MELKHYISILWRRKWIIGTSVAVTLLVVAIGHSISTPVYVAVSTLRVAASLGGTQNYSLYSYNEQLMNTYVQIAASRPVMEELAERLGVIQPPAVYAEVIPQTELIVITTEASDPELAASTSNTLAQILIDQQQRLYSGGAASSSEILSQQVEVSRLDVEKVRKEFESLIIQTPAAPDKITATNQILQEKQRTYETLLRQYEQAQYREAIEASMITIVEEAAVPQVPAKPRVALDFALGGILGLVAGILLALVFENIDDRLFTSREIETEANAPTLAKLPHAKKNQLDYANNKFSPLIESMRYLVARLQLDSSKTSKKALMLTSMEPGQGTSTICANLACLLAEQGKSVALVDFNLRRPKLHELFGLTNDKGLMDVLSGTTDWEKSIQTAPVEGVSVLATGPAAGAPLQVFDPVRMEKLIASLRQQFEYIIMDAPALSVADAAMLAPQSDGVILVARRSYTRRGSIRSAAEFLSRLNGKFIGLVVNEAEK